MLGSMTTASLPPRDEMLTAFLEGDAGYDGLFFTAVTTTGIFCRPSCPARKPKPSNVEFFARATEAAVAGYRPCKRCRPLEPADAPPAWLRPLLDEVEADPTRRWKDADLRALGMDPVRVRRWFSAHHGMTFLAWQRSRRLGSALQKLGEGEDLLGTGLDHGWDSASGFADAVTKLAGTSPGRARDAKVAWVMRLDSPVGPLLAGATDEGVCLLEFTDRRMLERQLSILGKRLGVVLAPGTHPHLEQLARELAAYFAGGLRRFEVPLHIAGTPFQESVWQELLAIPYGTTIAYAELARRIGRPTAHRAVARANGDNRMAILIPCHRVVASDGTLSGYGGGVWRKRRLLDLEGAAPAS
jgi:AraC family transcriptional regulator of adaptative response/methylated-DNA-[protein]-cysteine methyltransferase